eukprot:2524098-Rhodomonas_salina.1
MTCSSRARPGASQASSRPLRGHRTSCPHSNVRRRGCRELQREAVGIGGVETCKRRRGSCLLYTSDAGRRYA